MNRTASEPTAAVGAMEKLKVPEVIGPETPPTKVLERLETTAVEALFCLRVEQLSFEF